MKSLIIILLLLINTNASGLFEYDSSKKFKIKISFIYNKQTKLSLNYLRLDFPMDGLLTDITYNHIAIKNFFRGNFNG